ncbi:hypothetical protein BS78_07G000600 [Paspalum vaginatum]|nr:hypothetical protein BS78_07G000600 [Paspalum vaginatum]
MPAAVSLGNSVSSPWWPLPLRLQLLLAVLRPAAAASCSPNSTVLRGGSAQQPARHRRRWQWIRGNDASPCGGGIPAATDACELAGACGGVTGHESTRLQLR